MKQVTFAPLGEWSVRTLSCSCAIPSEAWRVHIQGRRTTTPFAQGVGSLLNSQTLPTAIRDALKLLSQVELRKEGKQRLLRFAPSTL